MFSFRLIPLGEKYKPLILPAMSYIVVLMFFYKDGFGIK